MPWRVTHVVGVPMVRSSLWQSSDPFSRWRTLRVLRVLGNDEKNHFKHFCAGLCGKLSFHFSRVNMWEQDCQVVGFTAKLFSRVVVPFCRPTNDVWEFQLFCILISSWLCQVFTKLLVILRNSPVVQWLGLGAFTAVVLGLIPVGGTGIPQVTQHGQTAPAPPKKF